MKPKIAIIYDNEKCFSKTISRYISIGIKKNNIEVKMYSSNYTLNNIKCLKNLHAIVIGGPTYFGNVSSNIKKFMDNSLDTWKKREWRNKLASGFTYSYSINGDKLNMLMSVFIFSQQHGMIWKGLDIKSNQKSKKRKLNKMGSWVGLMTKIFKNNKDLDEIETIKYFGKNIANTIQKIKCNF